MKHTIKDLSVKIEKFCIEWDQFDRSRPFSGWRKKDYAETAASYKELLWYFADIKKNFPAATVQKEPWYILVNYGKGSAKIKIDLMMEEILLPEVEQYFQLYKSKLAA